MINDNTTKTYTINLTHIATSYPHSFDISDDTILKLEDGKEFFLDELKTKKLIGYGGQDITYDFLSNLDTNNSINSNWSTKLSSFRLFKKK